MNRRTESVSVDSPDYDGLVDIPFEHYSFDIRFDRETSVVVFGCDCAAAMSDEIAVQVHAALTKYLTDRGLLGSVDNRGTDD